MERRDNYLIQAKQAKARFLTYDQEKLIAKFGLEADGDYLYLKMLCKQYRLNRATGDLEYRAGDAWLDGNSYNEVMTVLDLLCDSRDDRRISGQWQSMQAMGLQFHQNLLEEKRDAFADAIDAQPEKFCAACAALGGEKISGGDMGYAVELFDGLKIGMLFWHGDEEFVPRIRWLWDANAKMYIRYETMYFAVSLLRQRILELMQ